MINSLAALRPDPVETVRRAFQAHLERLEALRSRIDSYTPPKVKVSKPVAWYNAAPPIPRKRRAAAFMTDIAWLSNRPPKKPRRAPSGIKKKSVMVEQVAEILTQRRAGGSYIEIGQRLDVSHQTVGRICRANKLGCKSGIAATPAK